MSIVTTFETSSFNKIQNMISAGIDIGSRTIKVVLLEDNKMTFEKVVDNSFNPIETCRSILEELKYDRITSTGYGRHLFADYYKSEVISEIKAFAMGIHHVFPTARTILDIGGQDTKAISIDDKGQIMKFEMNDKCAAGTGRFLEIMSMALRFSLDEFSQQALSTKESVNINSMCAVFAESEIISMLSKGEDRTKIARGIHHSVIKKSMAIIKRVGIQKDIAFAGGGARSNALRVLMEEVYQQKVLVPSNPQIIGALGCAIYSQNQ
jgi:predicted CoA-substrate-specific enzyme activase